MLACNVDLHRIKEGKVIGGGFMLDFIDPSFMLPLCRPISLCSGVRGGLTQSERSVVQTSARTATWIDISVPRALQLYTPLGHKSVDTRASSKSGIHLEQRFSTFSDSRTISQILSRFADHQQKFTFAWKNLN